MNHFHTHHRDFRLHAPLATILLAVAVSFLAPSADAQLPAFFSDSPTHFLGYVRAVANTTQVCEDRSSPWSYDLVDYPLPAGADDLSAEVIQATHIHNGSSTIDFNEFVVDSSGLVLDFDFDLDLVGCERENNNVNSISERIAPPANFFVPHFAITVTEDVGVEIGGNIAAVGTGTALLATIQFRDSTGALLYSSGTWRRDSTTLVFDDFEAELPPDVYTLQFQFNLYCHESVPCEPAAGGGRFFIRMTPPTPEEILQELIEGLQEVPPTVDGMEISTDPADGDMTSPNIQLNAAHLWIFTLRLAAAEAAMDAGNYAAACTLLQWALNMVQPPNAWFTGPVAAALEATISDIRDGAGC